MLSPPKNSGTPSPWPDALGSKCRVSKLSSWHNRANFCCGCHDLNTPLYDWTERSAYQGRIYLGASLGDQRHVLGYACLEVSDHFVVDGLNGPSCYISRLAVDTGCQGRGVGSRLVSESLMLAKEWLDDGQIGLAALHAKPELHGFYQRFGFVEIDGMLMVLPPSTLRQL